MARETGLVTGEAGGRLPAAERQLPAVDPMTDMTRFAENDAARALVAGSHPIARLPVPQVAPYTGNVDQFVTKGWWREREAERDRERGRENKTERERETERARGSPRAKGRQRHR